MSSIELLSSAHPRLWPSLAHDQTLLLLLLTFLLLARHGAAQTAQVSVKPLLTHVTVYLKWHNARVSRAANPGSEAEPRGTEGLPPLYSEEKLEVILGSVPSCKAWEATTTTTKTTSPSRFSASNALAHSLTRMQASVGRTEAELMGLQQKVRFRFEVEYPKDKTVDIVNLEQISKNPKFR